MFPVHCWSLVTDRLGLGHLSLPASPYLASSVSPLGLRASSLQQGWHADLLPFAVDPWLGSGAADSPPALRAEH